MKIVEYKITPIAFGDPPLRSAFGLHAPYALRTIVEVVSDDGIAGASETHGGAAVVVTDGDLDASRLRSEVDALLSDRSRLAQMAAASEALARPNAAADIAAEVVKAAEGR